MACCTTSRVTRLTRATGERFRLPPERDRELARFTAGFPRRAVALRFAPPRFAALRFAALRLAAPRLADPRLPLRAAPARFAPPRLLPLRAAPRFIPPRFLDDFLLAMWTSPRDERTGVVHSKIQAQPPLRVAAAVPSTYNESGVVLPVERP